MIAGAADPPIAASSDTIHAIAWKGTSAVAPATFADRLSIKPGGPYDPHQVDFSKDLIASIFRDKGYADAAVVAHLDRISPHQVDILFEVSEGPLYHVRDIDIQGNKNVPQRLIQRDLGIKRGDIFSQAQIFKGNEQLFLSGYFETVDIHYSTAPAHQMDIQINVKERATRYIKGGAGYGTQTKERVSLGYEDRNFFGNERQLDISAVHSGFLTNPQKYRTTLLQTRLTQAHFFDTKYEAQTSVSEEWDDRDAYNSRATTWLSSLGRRFSQEITGSLRYRYTGTQLTRIDPSAASTTPPFTNVSAAGPTFTYDGTNDPFLPTKGWRVTSLLEKGFKGIGDINFTRFEARVGRFDTLPAGLSTFVGLQSGIIRPDNPGDSIPIFERYTLGGANTVRGYEEQEIGPRDTQGNPVGGNASGAANLEVRHGLYKKVYVLWFLDGGQLYEQAPGDSWPYIRAKSLADFDYGTGPGLRLNTPVGAARFEVGYKLNPTSGATGFFQRTTIHFSLGEVF